MPRTLTRRPATSALFALSLAGCLAAGGHASAPSSAAQSRSYVKFDFASTSPYRVSEGDGGVDVTVVRSGGADGRGDLDRHVSVEYQASDGYLMARGCGYLLWVGTAAPGQDYEAARGTLTFAPGEMAKTFRVVIKDDAAVESRNPEVIFLSLDFSAGAPPDSTDCFGRTSIIYIHDNDPPSPPQPAPSGRRQIAFSSNRDGNYEIYSMDADGANVRRLTNSLASEGRPAWSPDGKRIAFVSDGGGESGNYEIYVMNADGTNLVRLTNNPAHEALPAWQPGAVATPAGPVLLTETGSNRAVALDSVTFVLDPFTVVSPTNLLAADRRTRVALFAANVAQPVTASDITVQAEDSAGRAVQLPVEYVGRVNGFDWLTQVVVRLPDDVASADYLWIGLNVRGTLTNKAVVTMKAKQ